MLSHRQIVFAACFLVLPFLLWQFVSLSEQYSLSGARLWPETICTAILPTIEDEIHSIPQKRHRVAVASTFGFHHDVYMSLVWTLERVLDQTGGTVEVYAPQPFGFEFQTIVDTLRLYRGQVKDPETLLDNINQNMGDRGIDLVVLGTCEVDLRGGDWPEGLLDAWDARDDDHKFNLACIVHNFNDVSWQEWITPWSRRNAIRILPISEHVAAAFRRSFFIKSDSPDPSIRLAGYEYIPVDVHVPILDIPVPVDHRPPRILSDAVIQGSFSTDRRDYLEIFAELKESLARDPQVWGYLPLTAEDESYIVDPTLADPPFRLFLIGSGYLEIPSELRNLVLIRDGLNYSDFYTLMRTMDICVPAFSTGGGYYDSQASSTFAMAVECDVPILVTERIKNSYMYVNDDRAVVTRPAAMREVEALRALRTRDVSFFLNRTSTLNSPTAHAADAMMRMGWVRSEEKFRSLKQDIWRANERVGERMLRDM
ncbi:hypothetical protein DFH07DRAFT_814798 [Mycena maculata]|uniref:Glycosyltransferase family 1 protein n=1 Tax=Mycena maculata TaxID=230809 RepID=A0AAD7NH29_9AGAR|nr:hypothetical protein DFH07DRAFT_814798 [Mycena maculata]